MALKLPQNVTFVPYSDFSSDGYYDLAPGETKIFPWEVQPNGHTDITLIHNCLNSQDHTVQAWLSTEPLDYVMFSNISFMNWIDVSRTGTTASIYDVSTRPTTLLKAETETAYYLNVKNMSNEPNTFRVIFSFETGSGGSTPSDPNSPPYSELSPNDAIGTHTLYGIVVAQFSDELTLVHSDNGGDTYSLMSYNDLVATMKVRDNPDIKGMEDIIATYCDASKTKIEDLNFMVSWVAKKYGILSTQLFDASMNKIFWDTLVKYPGSLKMTLWDKKSGKRTQLNSDMLKCETLWERDSSLILLVQ